MIDGAQAKINCDVAFHMAVTWFSDQVMEEMDELTNKRGINSYKFFLAYNNVLRMYDDELLKIFARCKELGALAQVHAENGDMVDAGQQAMIDEMDLAIGSITKKIASNYDEINDIDDHNDEEAQVEERSRY